MSIFAPNRTVMEVRAQEVVIRYKSRQSYGACRATRRSTRFQSVHVPESPLKLIQNTKDFCQQQTSPQHLVANFPVVVMVVLVLLVGLDFEGPEGSGLGYAKRDPREDLVDQEFKSRTYKKDKNGHIHMQARSSRVTAACSS
ncbi:hypothetical protein IW261DRAFT_1422527 [Armillaria novae-zelandiae]|uniref:Uncharacterized protein n=1 Tax=Armillaria novae-zelandiae TaxID=153914 RepID=A0AA39P0D3_9AGAR|nr:hypothetical protein IW261DRAFT_1422527 [Armillaria novae-zelandiae]